MVRLRWAVTAASLALIAAQPLSGATLAEDAIAFGTRDGARSMDLSPGGHKLLFVTPGPTRETLLRVADLDTGERKIILKFSADPESLDWCAFATDTQIICEYSATQRFNNSLVEFSRLVTLGIDGSNVRPIGPRASDLDLDLHQSVGHVIDWSSDRPGSILLASYHSPQRSEGTLAPDKRGGLGVDRIDLSSLKIDRIELPRETAENYLSDMKGNVRIMGEMIHGGTDAQMTGVMRFKYRTAGSKDWKPLGDYDTRTGQGLYPIAVDGDMDAAYILRKTDGRDALYTMKLDGSGTTTLVAADKRSDIESVVRASRTQRVIGYTYADERMQTVYFDPEYAKLAKSLAKALPTQPIINFVGVTSDGTKLLIMARGDTSPGTYYLLDKATKHLEQLGVVRPELNGRTLATVTAVGLPADDGTPIPAYLTLPAGSTGKNLPAVVFPHGGPSARDVWGFDWLAQFFAARGYAVIQPNYRGSAGYGDQWLGQNAFRDWRKAISDVNAAGHYLVKQGIADPNRLAIVGWSYGGYAALQAAATEPSLYKASVAIAPVTDLATLRRDAMAFTNANLTRDFVGTGEEANAGSPLRNAAAIKASVLLIHGDKDANVNIDHSRKMASALRSAGATPELLVFKDLDHQLEDTAARREMLTRIGAMLDRTIGH